MPGATPGGGTGPGPGGTEPPPGLTTTTTVRKPVGPPDAILRRPYLVAHNAVTGELLDWDPQTNEAVLSLAVSPDGRRLYVGGRFRRIGGGPAGRIAALDIATGRLDPALSAEVGDGFVMFSAIG